MKTTLFVAALFLLALSACGQRHEATYRFAQFPASDEPLKKWFEAQAGIRDVEISREGNALQVRYYSDEMTVPHSTLWGAGLRIARRGYNYFTKFFLSHSAHCSGHGRDCSPDYRPLAVLAAPLRGSGGK